MDSVNDVPRSVFFLLPLLIFASYHFVVYPALISPLSRIPNAHWSAPISPLWILYKRFSHHENDALIDAHKRLGPYIRVAPNEVSVDDIDGVRTIYQGGFEKPIWYGVFDNYGVPCMFSTRTSRDHSLRKRMISNVYSKSFIQSSPAATAQAERILHDRLLPTLETAEAGRGIDVYSLFSAVVMDFIAAYIWGLSCSTNFIQEKAYREHWLELYKSRNDYPFFPQELPRLTEFCLRFGLHLYPHWVDAANGELAEWNVKICRRALEHLEASGLSGDQADEPVVMKALLQGIEKEAAHGEKSPLFSTAVLQRDLTIQSELWDHVLAGQETAGITLTYLAWRMSQHPEVQVELRQELRSSLRSPVTGNGGLPDLKKLDSLPLLHAIVMETLRLHAPIPGAQPRAVPSPSAKVGPYVLPGGVRIAAMAHTLHRDGSVFPDAENWNPKRWIKNDEMQKKAMNRLFWAFSSGGRMCIGSNFAMQDIRFAVRAEVQQRSEPLEAAITRIRALYSTVTRTWSSMFLSLLIAILSVAAGRALFEPAYGRPVPDLVKVAGIARSFEPLIYYSEHGVAQVGDLQATGVAVWDLGESVRSSNLTSAPIIVKELDELSDSLKTLAIELTKFFANVDGDIDGILIVMDWARRELNQLTKSTHPTYPLTSAFDNIHNLLSHIGLLETPATGEPTRLGTLLTSLFGPSSPQRTRHTLQRTFNEFLAVLEQAIHDELHHSLALFGLFEAIDHQFLNLARAVAREASAQDERHADLLSSLWTRILGARAGDVAKYERNRLLLLNVREKTVRNKGVLVEHNHKLLALKSSLEALRRKLVSPLVRSVNSSTLTLDEQIRGLEDVGGYLEGVRARQKGKLMEMLYGSGSVRHGGGERLIESEARGDADARRRLFS